MGTPTLSLYEKLYPLTTVGKQRFVELFNGSDIDTNIWNKNTVIGAATFAMADSIDEGYSIKATNAGDYASINFNNIRPISNTASTIISVVKRFSNGTSDIARFGLKNTTSSDVNVAYMQDVQGTSFKILRTGDGTTTTDTNTTTAPDTSWHKYKIVLGSSNVTLAIEGVIQATSTTHLPAARLQPDFSAGLGAASNEARIKYLEVFNQ